MSRLYIYAIVGEADPVGLGRGVGGEAIESRRIGSVTAIVEKLASPPVPSADLLRRHDAVVRRVESVADAILPARFGQVALDDGALERGLSACLDRLSSALAEVAGCEQMTLRLFGESAARGPGDDRPASGARAGRGTTYLRDRIRREAERRSLSTGACACAAPVLDAVSTMARAERIRRHARPPLLASIHHLIPRGSADAYLARVAESRRFLEGSRVVSSGPWPPYAFVPELDHVSL